jgi:pimeloyl-ACP methyl ester carboxylesterase
MRNGQQSALAVDAIKLKDSLNIKQATVAAFDWRARTADIVAALWLEAMQGLGLRQRLSHRLGLTEGEQFDEFETKLASAPGIQVPAITMEGDANGAPHPDPKADAGKFKAKYEHRLIKGGMGHNLPQESPEAFAQAVIDADAWASPSASVDGPSEDRQPLGTNELTYRIFG